jgi:glycosyltransferase involved in cell wall biosynthesis
MENSIIKIAIVGDTGFPYRIGADISKRMLIAKGISLCNCKVLVINRRSYQTKKIHPVSGHIGRVIYTNSSGIAVRHSNVIIRNLYKIKGAFNEILILKRQKVHAVIADTPSFPLVLFYWFWGWILGYKLFMTYVEYYSQLPYRQKISLRINDIFFEKYVFRLLDGVFPISHFLKNVALKSNPRLSCLLVPVLVDFDSFNITRHNEAPYFVFCGNAGYTHTIEFILKAFECINDKINLALIIYGKGRDIDRINSLVNSLKKKLQVQIITDLDYENGLIQYFLNARGLLIPMKPSLRDEARFPHKIGEYSAAGVPIITTNVGEIKYYFKNEVDALIAERFEPELYAQKMEFVIHNPEKAKEIGAKGRETGQKHFDYKVYGKLMKEFIEGIL